MIMGDYTGSLEERMENFTRTLPGRKSDPGRFELRV